MFFFVHVHLSKIEMIDIFLLEFFIQLKKIPLIDSEMCFVNTFNLS